MSTKKLLGKPNAKLKKAGIRQFSIPAYETIDGFRTCPMAGECKAFCYAGCGPYKWDSVAEKHHYNLNLYREDSRLFVETMILELKARRFKKPIRIHDTGDFFNKQYLNAWLTIIAACPETLFYAYTKSLHLFDYQSGFYLLDNFFVRFSYGGTLDHKIKSTDYNSRVFPDYQSAVSAGYLVCPSDDDSMAFNPDVVNLGLIVHGDNKKHFTV